jgi:16S rRNA (cytidine1402-2'-O)-methyltransferase
MLGYTGEMATLYIVPTPIGNLEDMTLRAIRILKDEVDYIASEDTRTTKVLCNHYNITTPLISYHAHSTQGKADALIHHLSNGLSIALVSDAGTPTISDPGVRLINEVRRTLPQVSIVPLPGPSAFVTAFSASGITSGEFVFLGFLPHKKGRETLFKEIAESSRTMIFYESPHRLMKTLSSLEKYLKPEKTVVVAREITKIYESFIVGNAHEVHLHFTEHPDQVRGEIVILVEGN